MFMYMYIYMLIKALVGSPDTKEAFSCPNQGKKFNFFPSGLSHLCRPEIGIDFSPDFRPVPIVKGKTPDRVSEVGCSEEW